MNPLPDPSGSTSPAPISRHIAGPRGLRYYRDYNLIAWQPRGVLDDVMLDEIAKWVTEVEKELMSFNRFLDFSELTSIAIDTVMFLSSRKKELHSSSGIPCALVYFVRIGSALASRVCMSR